MAYNSSLKTKQCLRDSYAKKILSGEKEYRGTKEEFIAIFGKWW